MAKRNNLSGKYGHLRRRGGHQAAKYKRTLEATQAEAALSRALDDLGIKHQREYTVRTAESFTGYYLVDFRIPAYKLFIELDGKPHTSEVAQWKDRLRTEAIKTAIPSFTLIRAWNSEVLKDPHAWVDTNVIVRAA